MGDRFPAKLLIDVHQGLDPIPDLKSSSLVKGSYKYYHYKCDGFDDRGWGCGYRTLQTICSWFINVKGQESIQKPPDIRSIQKVLVDVGDKPVSFCGSRDWIGSFEIFTVLNSVFNVECRIVHVPCGSELPNYTNNIFQHFEKVGSPIMMGGHDDNSSKLILGIASNQKETYLLILDPHFYGEATSVSIVVNGGWVRWIPVSDFAAYGFYNLVFPLR